MIDGVTTTLTPFTDNGCHVYEAAPLAVIVDEFPGQILAEFVDKLIVGVGIMETFIVPDFTPQEAVVAETVYVVFTEGDAITLLPDVVLSDEPGVQV